MKRLILIEGLWNRIANEMKFVCLYIARDRASFPLIQELINLSPAASPPGVSLNFFGIIKIPRAKFSLSLTQHKLHAQHSTSSLITFLPRLVSLTIIPEMLSEYESSKGSPRLWPFINRNRLPARLSCRFRSLTLLVNVYVADFPTRNFRGRSSGKIITRLHSNGTQTKSQQNCT